MIYTVTFNPAIDYVVKTDEFQFGKVNRSKSEQAFFGGKGINVSRVLKTLGVDSTALGFIAGFTGEAIENELLKNEIQTDFVKLKSGFSRINVKIKSGEETELNGQGPKITNTDVDALFSKLSKAVNGDTVVLAGSIPNSLHDDIYEKICEKVTGHGAKVIVDATGDLLKNCIKYKPFLVKPNIYELSEIFGKEIKSEEEIIKCAGCMQSKGAVNVLVSMGGDGALLLDENGVIRRQKAPKGTLINSVGAGDSMVAGFVAGYIETKDYEFALKLGTAAGAATAFSDDLAKSERITEVLEKL